MYFENQKGEKKMKFVNSATPAVLSVAVLVFFLAGPLYDLSVGNVGATAKTAQLSPEEMKSLGIIPADKLLAVAKANEDKGNVIHLIKPLNESLPQLIHEVMTQMEFATEKGYTYIPMEMEDSPEGQELFNALKDKLEGSGYAVERNYMNAGRHIANGTHYFGYVVVLKK